MTGTTTSHDLFRPTRTRSETMAETTDRSARAIIEAEAKHRESKTEKLRQARFNNEALKTISTLPDPKRRSKATEPKPTASSSTKFRLGDKAAT